MIEALVVIGIASVLGGIAAGAITGYILIFFTFSVLFGIILFALALVLYNQKHLLAQIKNQEVLVRNLVQTEYVTCTNCNHEYERVMRSCPRCGNRTKLNT